jgi:hypothetical protein
MSLSGQPFPDLHCSPPMTAQKDFDKIHFIVDLSFSSGQAYSVDSMVDKSIKKGMAFLFKTHVETIC